MSRRQRPDVGEGHLALALACSIGGFALGTALRTRLAAAFARRHLAGRPALARRSRQLLGAAFGPRLRPDQRRRIERDWSARWWNGFTLGMQLTLRGRMPPLGQLAGSSALAGALARGGVLLVVPHFGPYPLAPALLAHHGFAPRVLGHALPYPWADRLVLGGYRARGWLLTNPAGPAAMARAVQRELAAGALVIASIDQAPAAHDNRTVAPFVAGSIHVATGVFAIARTARAPVFALVLDGAYTAISGAVVPLPDGAPPALAHAAVAILANQVRRDPGGWNWSLPQLGGPVA